MNIGLFETEHFEGIYPVVRLFDNGQNKLTLFVYEQSHTPLSYLLKTGHHSTTGW